jgi:outer membrane lipoprotein-sorting protein
MALLRRLMAGAVLSWLGAASALAEPTQNAALGRSPSASTSAAGAPASPFERLASDWQSMHDYSVTIDAHEELGAETDEHELHYAFRKPDRARLDVVNGTRSGTTIVWSGGSSVVAYRRSMSFLKMHGDPRQKDLTSLRGNGVLSPNIGDLVACFGEHREELIERSGPVIDGEATDEIALPYKDVTCPDDPPADKGAITLDVLDVSHKTGLILMRKRYAGDEVVERWELKDYVIDSGLRDADLR